MSSEHSNRAVLALRELREGSGGQVRVVYAESDEGALFPAGLGRKPSPTLLESVLSYTSGPGGHEHIWVLSAKDPHLQDNIRVGKDQVRIQRESCAWVFRGPGPGTAPAAKQGASAPPPPADGEIRPPPRPERPRRPQKDVPDLLNTFSGLWSNVILAVIGELERASGSQFANDDYRPVPDSMRPQGRILVVLDERLLFPAGAADIANIVGDRTDLTQRAMDRLNRIPELFANPPQNKKAADLILLCHERDRVRQLHEGRMIHDQFAKLIRAYQTHAPSAEGLDPRLPQMKWPRSVVGHEMPRVDSSHLLEDSFKDLDKAASLYTILREATPRLAPNPLETLQKMTGLAKVKAKVKRVFDLANEFALKRERKLPIGDLPMLHMIFAGNPGTGKTMVAEIVGKLYADAGILSGRKYMKVTGEELVSQFVRETGIKTRAVLESAAGGVLFIDEAYALTPKREEDHAHEAIPPLVEWMTKHRSDLAIIFAGYSESMRAFLDSNPGFDSRVHWIDFDDYNDEELMKIAREKLAKAQLTLAPGGDEALKEKLATHRANCLAAGRPFGNAREVERLITEAEGNRASRNAGTDLPLTTADLTTLRVEDIRSVEMPLPPKAPDGAAPGSRP